MYIDDEDLVLLVAELWVKHGRGAEEFDWLIREIRGAIDRLIDEEDEVYE